MHSMYHPVSSGHRGEYFFNFVTNGLINNSVFIYPGDILIIVIYPTERTESNPEHEETE